MESSQVCFYTSSYALQSFSTLSLHYDYRLFHDMTYFHQNNNFKNTDIIYIYNNKPVAMSECQYLLNKFHKFFIAF